MQVSVRNDFQSSEEGYRLLFESNPHPMWIYDRDTLAFLAVNDAAVKYYGYSRDEFLRMTIRDIRPATDVSWLLEKVSGIKPGMNSAAGRHLTKDGRLMNVEIVSHTLQFAGRPAALVLAMDLTNKPAHPHAPPDAPSVFYQFRDSQLTDAENRVASYVARGYDNKQIAQLLGISVRTVETHIGHILIKKRFKNRVQIARHVLETSKGL